MIVVDASALVIGVVEDSDRARSVRNLLIDGAIAPAFVDAEVGQGVRGLTLRDELDVGHGLRAIRAAARLVTERRPLAPLLARAWQLRDNVSFYDGLYVALAEERDLVLLTADQRLAGATGPRCRIEVV